MSDDRVECRNPVAGKQPTRIERWKYLAVRRAILATLAAEPAGVPFGELRSRVAERLSEAERAALGSLGWYTTTVKLDLEARGEIVRLPGSGAQRLRAR